MTNRILIVCEICGKNDKEVNGWRMKCKRLGGPVCSGCCLKCEWLSEFSGLYSCTFRSEEERRAAARKRSEERTRIENARITAIYMDKRREAARLAAIKKVKARQKEERRMQREEKRRTQGAQEAGQKEPQGSRETPGQAERV